VNLTGRETEIMRILKVLGQATNRFVLIGGYAVNAYGQHRFSVDCDLVTNDQILPMLARVLEKEGYTLQNPRARQPRGVNVMEYRKSVGTESAKVELFVNKVVNRSTAGTWTYNFVSENSGDETVVGATESILSRVAERNLLVAMKLHAARPQDLGDVVMLSKGTDWSKAASFCTTGSKRDLLDHLSRQTRELGSASVVNALRSNFALRTDPTSLVKEAARGLETLTKLVAEQKFRETL